MEEKLPIEFFRVIQRIEKKIARYMMRKLQFSNMKMEELIVLSTVSEYPGIMTTDLATIVGIPTSTITTVLDRLEGRDLIVRTRGQFDRRAVHIRCSELTKEMLLQYQEMLVQFVKESGVDFTDEVWAELINRLEFIEGKLGEEGKKQYVDTK